MSTYFRYTVSTINSYPTQAIAGANIAVLSQPADTSTQPGSPLVALFDASTSNAASINAASWVGGQATFTFTTTPPADVIAKSYISVLSASPTTFNGVWQVLSLSGNNVTVTMPTAPGTYTSGGTVATSALPNPFPSDPFGNGTFYTVPDIYTIQIYPNINGSQFPIQIIPDVVVVSPGGGSVTSVDVSVPTDIFTSSGGPITSNGVISIAKVNNIQANFVACGPSSGSPATWTFRALVAADIAGLGAGSVSSVDASVTPGSLFTASFTGGPITSTGTLALSFDFNNQAANTIIAGPSSGGTGPITARSLVGADLPLPSSSSLGGVQSITAVSHNFLTGISTSGVPAQSQPNFTDIAGTATLAQIGQTQATITFVATPVFLATGNGSNIISLTGNVTSSTITGGTAGQRFTFIIKQDATGSRTLVFPTNVKGAGSIAATASGFNVQDFIFDGTNWLASSSMQSFV